MVRFAGAPPPGVRARWPEVVTAPDVADAGRTQAWAVGPGIGTDDAGRDGARRRRRQGRAARGRRRRHHPAGHHDELRAAIHGRPVLLTPHDGEFARIAGEVGADRIAAARRAAAELGVTVLLKGNATVVADPDGRALVRTRRARGRRPRARATSSPASSARCSPPGWSRGGRPGARRSCTGGRPTSPPTGAPAPASASRRRSRRPSGDCAGRPAQRPRRSRGRMRRCGGGHPAAPAPRRSSISPRSGTTSPCCAAAAPGAALMAVVKADGYGHGAVPVARAALAAGATWLGVCTIEEALELRAAGIDAPGCCRGCTCPTTTSRRPSPPASTSSVASRAHLAAVLAGARRGRPPGPAAPQDRHRAHPQRRAARRLARPARRRGQGRGRRRGAGRRRLVAPGARRRAPTTPRSTGRPPGSTRPGAPRASAAWTRSATWPTPRPPSPAPTCTSTSSARASPCTGSTRSADRCARARCARR